MNTIGTYNEKPNAYYIGKLHERYIYNIIRTSPNCEIVQCWLDSLYPCEDKHSFSLNSIYPEHHIEKKDLSIAVSRKINSHYHLDIHDVSAKCGTTSMPGQIYRGTLENAVKMGFIPCENDDSILFNTHSQWLKERKNLEDTRHLELDKLLNWYKTNWEYILHSTLFGKDKNCVSALILSNLEYQIESKKMIVQQSALITKKQMIKDLLLLSPSKNVNININNRGIISSGIISIQRAGGSNGEKAAEDWQVRINRAAYLKWLNVNRPNEMWKINSQL